MFSMEGRAKKHWARFARQLSMKLDRCGRIFNGRLLMWAIIGALRYKHSGNKWLLKTPAYAHLFFDSSRLIRCCTLLCEAYVLSIAAAFDPPTQNTQTG